LSAEDWVGCIQVLVVAAVLLLTLLFQARKQERRAPPAPVPPKLAEEVAPLPPTPPPRRSIPILESHQASIGLLDRIDPSGRLTDAQLGWVLSEVFRREIRPRILRQSED
jgi:hypothetical protein